MCSNGKSKSKLTIFVLCHNRVDYVKQTIYSIIGQTNQEFNWVVSDNSTIDEVSDMIKSEFPSLEIRRRVPSLPSIDHLNLCISEVDTEYLCLFHDDDLMAPDYVASMLEMIERYPLAVAYACNAEIVDQFNNYKHSSFESRSSYLPIRSPHDLAGRYFSRFPNGFAPFPSYIYRSTVAKGHPLDSRTGGKYSDFTWLVEIAKQGDIVWNCRNLIKYRLHASNDGGIESTGDRLRLLGYLKANIYPLGQDIVDDYRFFLYKKICSAKIGGRRRSEKLTGLLKRYLFSYRLRRIFRKNTYGYLYYKSTKKLGSI